MVFVARTQPNSEELDAAAVVHCIPQAELLRQVTRAHSANVVKLIEHNVSSDILNVLCTLKRVVCSSGFPIRQTCY
jgi:hypothetical protein